MATRNGVGGDVRFTLDVIVRAGMRLFPFSVGFGPLNFRTERKETHHIKCYMAQRVELEPRRAENPQFETKLRKVAPHREQTERLYTVGSSKSTELQYYFNAN